MSLPFQYPCIRCGGRQIDYTGEVCELCQGTGWAPVELWEAVWRTREYIGLTHPLADRNGYEKFARLTADLPPEVVARLERLHKKRLGVNVGSFARTKMVTAALLHYLDSFDPDVEWVDGTAVEITAIELPEEIE